MYMWKHGAGILAFFPESQLWGYWAIVFNGKSREGREEKEGEQEDEEERRQTEHWHEEEEKKKEEEALEDLELS